MGVLEAPIEVRMALLAPAPAELVRCSLTGPARIRGAAGTRQDRRRPLSKFLCFTLAALFDVSHR